MTDKQTLTPFDTGAIHEPKLHHDQSGMVDFDNDESATVATVSAWRTHGRSDINSVTVNIDTHGVDHVKIVLDDATAFEEFVTSPGPEPTAAQYAALGRFTAALLGSNANWECADFCGDIASHVADVINNEAAPFPGIGGHTDDELKHWRAIADELGIAHDED